MKTDAFFLIIISIIVLLIYLFRFLHEIYLLKIEEHKMQLQQSKIIADFKQQYELEEQKQKTIIITVLAIATLTVLRKNNIIYPSKTIFKNTKP